MSQVRVRFAPSPTGQVHIGNIRAAIFNWLYARNTGGKFLLRVEDTDLERSTPEAIQTLLSVMDWLGLNYDEEVTYQTRNAGKHLEAAERLLACGRAYRENKGGKGECIVFKMPTEGRLEFTDLVKGRMRKKAEDSQDFVIVRSDGSPVFHLANVVDDIEQRITHVIRGDDHVENTFKHIELFRALGYEPPQYGHLPMIVNNQGKPYSKRDGAAFVGEFREQGFLPDALFNFLALLGWAPGDDREVMSREEMTEAFSLERCKSSAARFDMKKLVWMNGEYLRALPRDELDAEFRRRARLGGIDVDSIGGRKWEEVLSLMIPRTKLFSEVPTNCAYFFSEEYPFDEKAVAKRLHTESARGILLASADAFGALPEFTRETTEAALRALGASCGSGLGALVHPVRVAVSGMSEGPGLFEILEILGREKVCGRLHAAAERFCREAAENP